MKKTNGIKCGIATMALAALLLVPFSGSIHAASAPTQAPAPATQTQAQKPSPLGHGTHVLEWGAFTIAAGEVAGLLGMGLSRVRQDKRRAAKKKATEQARPAYTGVPLPYAQYCNRTGNPAA